MTKQEAIAWLKGERSCCNTIPEHPLETWQVRIAQADAAYTQQAYWLLKANMELGQPITTRWDKGSKTTAVGSGGEELDDE